jgi:hypothetical protein
LAGSGVPVNGSIDPLLTVANDRYRAPDVGNSQELVTPKMVVAQRSSYEMAAISVRLAILVQHLAGNKKHA